MFLARHEIYYEKTRYFLIISVISLIAFLIFIISALTFGLAHQNTAAISSWQTKSVLMTTDANGNLSQSLLRPDDINSQKIDTHTALIGITPANANKIGSNNRETIQYIGLRPKDYIYRNLKLTHGKLPTHKNEVVISDNLADFKLNETIKIGMDQKKYKIVGLTHDAYYNMAPVIYGPLTSWAPIKGVSNQFKASGLISKNNTFLKTNKQQLKVYSRQNYLQKLPGYNAQNTTFIFMISFLIIISLVVITIFLYILTIQKIPHLAILRAQGIPNSYLMQNTFFETLIIMLSAIIIGGSLMTISSLFIPKDVPLYINLPLLSATALGLLLTGLLGALIPMRIIAKIDPIFVIGG